MCFLSLVSLFADNTTIEYRTIEGDYINCKIVNANNKTVEVATGNYANINKLTIPSTVEYNGQVYTVVGISDYAFFNCESLTYVFFPNTIQYIGENSFFGCENLLEIKLEEGLKRIGKGAFSCCDKLIAVNIPKSVTHIWDGAFNGCDRLEKVIISDLSAWCNIYFESAASNPLLCAKHLYLGESTEITDLNIPDEITTIKNCAFRGCSGITSVTIPNSVKYIGEKSFAGCSGLTSITIPNSVTSIGQGAFANCTGLTNITISNSVVSIGDYAFSGCTSLTHISLPNDLQTLGYAAFRGSSLESISIPQSITSINEETFQDCMSLSSITLPRNLQKLSLNAFENCKSLKSIYCMDKTPSSLSDYVFYNASTNISLFVPFNSSSLYMNTSGWKIGKYIKNIIEYPYEGDTFRCKLDNTEGSKDVDFLIVGTGQYDIQLGIGNPIDYNEDVDTLDIPDSIMYNDIRLNLIGIGEKAFSKTMFHTIKIPKSVKYIRNSAFDDCPNLSSLYVNWRKPNRIIVEGNNFAQIPSNCILFVPMGTIESYMSISPWNCFSKIIEVGSPVSMGDISLRHGSSTNLPIFLKNDGKIAGIQFKLTLPNNVSIDNNDKHLIASLTERTEGMTVLGGKDPDEDNSYLFVLLSLDGHSISGEEGAIMNIPLNVAPEMATGYYEMKLEDVQMATSTFETLTPADATSDLTVRNYDIGDINDDGYIDVADLTASVKFILGNAGNNLLFMAADVDESGIVEINDYSAVVNMVLAQDREVQHVRARHLPAENDHSVCALTPTTTFIKQNGEGEVMVALINDGNKYTGMQFDLSLPEGLIIADDGISASSKKHDVIFTKKQNGGYRVLCTSDNNAELYGDSIALRIRLKDVGAMTGTYEITMNNVVLSDMDAIRHTSKSQVSSVLVGDVTTGLSESTNQLEVIADQGQLTLKSHRQQTVTIVSLSGIVINQFEMNDGETITLKLGSGIYFVNEKMIINK